MKKSKTLVWSDGSETDIITWSDGSTSKIRRPSTKFNELADRVRSAAKKFSENKDQ